MAHGVTHGVSHGVVHGVDHGDTVIPGVTRDATSLKYTPVDNTEWTALMSAAGLGTGNPTHLWMMESAGSPVPDDIGADDMTELGGGAGYQQAHAGWDKTGVTFSDAAGNTLLTAASYNSSTLFLAYIGLTGTPAATRSMMYAQGEVGMETTRFVSGDTATGAVDFGTTEVRPVLIKVDRTNSAKRVYTNQEIVVEPYASATNVVGFGAVISSSAAMWVGYSALWTGAAAELSDANIRTLLTTLGFSVAW